MCACFHCLCASEGTATVLSDGVCVCMCFGVCVVFVCALQLQGVLARLASWVWSLFFYQCMTPAGFLPISKSASDTCCGFLPCALNLLLSCFHKFNTVIRLPRGIEAPVVVPDCVNFLYITTPCEPSR